MKQGQQQAVEAAAAWAKAAKAFPTPDLLAAQRAGALGIGLLSGGYGREELERSGAYRVYADPAEMLTRLEEVGVRPIR